MSKEIEKETYLIEYNSFGIAYVSALSFEEAESIFRHEHPDKDTFKIKIIKVIAGEILCP